MKQPLLFLFSFCLISLLSCQKKQYASFQNSSQTQYNHYSKRTELKIADKSVTDDIALPAAPSENVSVDNETVMSISAAMAPISEKPVINEIAQPNPDVKVNKKMTLGQKVKTIRQLNKLSKYVSEKTAIAEGSTKSTSNSDDTLAIVSLVLGLAGIVALVLGGWIGILFGLAAMITGIISLKSTSKRILAVIGIVLGAALLLLGIIVVVFLASLLSNL